MKGILIYPDRCMSCKSCVNACAVEHSTSKNLTDAMKERPRLKTTFFVEAMGDPGSMPAIIAMRHPPASFSSGDTETLQAIPINCRQCEEPLCVSVCPSKALTREPHSDLITYHQDKCLGCWMCMMSCPFGVIVEAPSPSGGPYRCDRCPDRSEPACVSACPTGAIKFGELDQLTRQRRKSLLKAHLSS